MSIYLCLGSDEMSFNPNEVTIGREFSNNVPYKIPRYQRKYVWNEEQWRNLIEDIILSMEKQENDNYHFIGSFIFEKTTNEWIVVDGQQRLTTITILIAVISKFFALNNQPNLYSGIRKYCTFNNDDGNQQMRVVNEDFAIFSNIIFDYFQNPESTSNLSKYFESENISIDKYGALFIKCYNFFYSYIDLKIKELDCNEKIEWLCAFRDAVINLKAIEITVDKEQEGYIIFEILNSRGLPLEQHELLKNYIFMYYKDSVGSDIAKDKWNKIISNVEGMSLSSLKRFITHYITHCIGKTSKKNEYYVLKEHTPKENVKELLDDLLFKSELYNSFNNIVDTKYTPTINYVLRFLNANNNYQFRPILLSLFEAYTKGYLSIKKLEKYLLSIKNFLSIHIVVCKEKTNTIENIIYKYALDLHLNFSKELMDDFIDELFNKTDKDKFVSAFSQLTFSNQHKKHPEIKHNARKECRHILQEYELYLAKIDDCVLTKFTIEHILPDSTNCCSACYIGNLIPLVKRINNNFKDAPVDQKINKYKEINFCSVKEFVNLYNNTQTWNEKTIKERTNNLANIFWKNIWTKI